jgi:DNA-binding LacI/PurR family transcriptional regulator
MGYDDQPLSKYAAVPITTIHQPVDDLAKAAVHKLLDNLKVKNHIQVPKMKLKVIIRKST